MNIIHPNSIAKDIILTILTLGFWNIWVQFRQIEDTNWILKENKIPSFFKVLLLSLITLGLYFCYHEFKLTRELHLINFGRTYLHLEIFFGFMTLLGLWFFVDSYQQSLLNRFIDSSLKLQTSPI